MAKSSYSAKPKTARSMADAIAQGRMELPKVMTRDQAVAFIKHGSRGRIMGVDVTKRTTGTARYMICRYGVRSRSKGIGLKFNPDAKLLIVMFDLQKDAYRMLNIPGINGILFGGRYTKVK